MNVATSPTDLRKSYDELAAIVEAQFARQVRAGNVFVFVNRRATQMRMLVWDRDGYCILMKRLEAGALINQALEREVAAALSRIVPRRRPSAR